MALRSAVEIDAPFEQVRGLLLDFARYPEWSPFVVAIRGEARVGAVIELDVCFAHGRVRRSKERIEVFEVGSDRVEVTWRYADLLGRLGLVRSRRRQILTRWDGSRSRYETEMLMGGPLWPLLPRRLIQRGLDDSAEALRAWADEGLAATNH